MRDLGKSLLGGGSVGMTGTPKTFAGDRAEVPGFAPGLPGAAPGERGATAPRRSVAASKETAPLDFCARGSFDRRGGDVCSGGDGGGAPEKRAMRSLKKSASSL